MFTGIVKGKALVALVAREEGILHYSVAFPEDWLAGLQIGASVAVDGVCQTVVKIEGDKVHFDAIAETLACTTLNTLAVGSAVNIERSLKFGDEVGGHLLSGHVIGTATIIERKETAHNTELWFCVPSDWTRFLLPKGYVAIDGASLTIGSVEREGRFNVSLIPETLRITTLGQKQVGDLVNIEIDAQTQAVVSAVEHYLSQKKGAL